MTAEHAEYAEAEKQRKGIPLSPLSAWSAYSAVEWIEKDRRSLRAFSGSAVRMTGDFSAFIRVISEIRGPKFRGLEIIATVHDP